MADRAVELLGQHITALEAHLQRLRTIQNCLAEDPSLASDLAEILLQPKANGRINLPQARGELPDVPYLHKILAVFKKNGNEWTRTAKLIVCWFSLIWKNRLVELATKG